MKHIIAVILFLCCAHPLAAQDNLWQENPGRTSLLLFVDGGVAKSRQFYAGSAYQAGWGTTTNFLAVFEAPASPRSNVLLKVGVGHRMDDITPAGASFRSKSGDLTLSLGFGVRFLFDR